MSDDDVETPRPRLRPVETGPDARLPRPSPRPDARPDPTPERGDPTRPTERAVPVRAVQLAGLVVLLLLAVPGAGGIAAVVGVPLALTLPGAVLQPRFLPGLRTDVVTGWGLRVVLSLGTWALVGLAVGAAGIPVRSMWTVVVAVVLLASVVVSGPAGGTGPGWATVRQVAWGAGVVAAVVLLALGARALVAVAGGTAGPSTGVAATVAFADPTTPFALTATGARATAQVVVTNAGDRSVHLELEGAVGRGLPWSTVEVDVPAGATRTVSVTGTVPVCSDPQQAVVTVDGAGDVAPLSAVLPGTDGAPQCGSV